MTNKYDKVNLGDTLKVAEIIRDLKFPSYTKELFIRVFIYFFENKHKVKGFNEEDFREASK